MSDKEEKLYKKDLEYWNEEFLNVKILKMDIVGLG